jgi:2-methylcitrate dehydratase
MHLQTYEFAMVVAQPPSYKPESRETADHSLPYCLAIGLIEGDVGPDQFQKEQWKDPKVLELMSKIKISVDTELDKLYPPARPACLEIRSKKGPSFRARVDYPKGDPQNPMTDEEVQAKFRKLANRLMGKCQIDRIIEVVNRIEKIDDIGEITKLLVV